MQKKMLWGLGVFVLLICTAFIFMTVRNRAEIRQLKKEYAVTEKPSEDGNKRKPVEKADEQPPAEQGFKWVWHNDHWDKVPLPTPVEVSNKTQQQADVTPQGLKKYVGGTPIPEDMPMPDIPLPVDLKNMDWEQWSQKHRTEWARYIHALDPAIERLKKEVDSLRANIPPEDSPAYAIWQAKSDPKILEYDRLITEKGERVHQWNAAREAAFEKYYLVRFGKKPYE